ncbi:MAG TPA: FAD-dependent oxidoreductase [Desulfobacteraceae bacterium]|nr:FAD-dependent oxidoreductase [Desulfobacteraceae bacterium]
MIRLNHLPTLRIKPGVPRSFTYGRRRLQGVEGDTVATALFANGVRVFGRSLKYHRPRGLYSLDGESSNTLVNVDGVPNVCAETTLLADGMCVASQNAFPGPDFDALGFMDALSWAMPAGFYYRMLHKPARLWPLAVPVIRKMAGVGTLAPDFQAPGRRDEIYPAADVCVIGAGVAGMSAALAAAEAGLRVVLFESRPWPGGAFEYRPGAARDGVACFQKTAELAAAVKASPHIRLFLNAPVIGVYSNGLVTAFQRGRSPHPFDERYIEVRAASVVVATGCIERPLLFEHNERPGVMQAGCAHRLARTWGILPGRTAVFSVGHDPGLEAAVDLFDLGVEIAAVADLRQDGLDPALVDALSRRRIPLLRGWSATKAHGRRRVAKVTLAGANGRFRKTLDCDLLVASAGFTPVTGPLTLAGAKLAFDERTGFFLPTCLPPRVHAAGRITGRQDWHAVAASGRLAGLCAIQDNGIDQTAAIGELADALGSLPGPVRGAKFVIAPDSGKKTFICFDEDATVKNVDQAMAKGFNVPELIKRFASVGTGPGQGGIPGHNLPLYVHQSGASPDAQPRPTTVRAPLTPTFLATYAGARLDMSKRTPIHDLQVAAGGRMERLGVWHRARRFSEDVHSREEILSVRTAVGILDASTLGKFRIFGPDAVKVLDRVYVGDMTRVPRTRAKYSAMCNEDGCLIDDGVIVRTGDNDYYLTTSTGRAGVTVEWIRYHTRFDDWDFGIVNLTDAYGVINLAGPEARAVLQRVTDADVSNEAFPFMGYREFAVGEVPLRAMRLGFVGELSFELHVPASWMAYVWNLLMDAGKDFGIRPFGLEAQNTLRLEKGHVIIGSESEQRTTLHDVGLGFLWHRDKPWARTVGDAALRQTEHQPGRLKLVGFRMADPSASPPRDGSVIVDRRIRGYVCTARYSVVLKEPVGLALVEDDSSAKGAPLAIYEDGCGGRLIQAVVTETPFYDPEGLRLRL